MCGINLEGEVRLFVERGLVVGCVVWIWFMGRWLKRGVQQGWLLLGRGWGVNGVVGEVGLRWVGMRMTSEGRGGGYSPKQYHT